MAKEILEWIKNTELYFRAKEEEGTIDTWRDNAFLFRSAFWLLRITTGGEARLAAFQEMVDLHPAMPQTWTHLRELATHVCQQSLATNRPTPSKQGTLTKGTSNDSPSCENAEVKKNKRKPKRRNKLQCWYCGTGGH